MSIITLFWRTGEHQLRPQIPLEACCRVLLPHCDGLRPKNDIFFLLLLCFLSIFPSFLFLFSLSPCSSLRASFPSFHPYSFVCGLQSFILFCFLSISLSFLFLYSFFLPICNYCFRPHPRDDSECSKLEAVEVLPPATLLCATNSLVAQGQCLSLAGIQKRCSEAQLELHFRFCVVMFMDGYWSKRRPPSVHNTGT